MTTEQKAKAYDEALKVLHKYDGANIMFTQDLKEEMFPELKESEDEKIRKGLIETIKYIGYGIFKDKGITYDKALAWLERQGEQKPINKIEPKFHEGEWVVSPNGVYWHIDKISNNRYEVTSNTGESSNWNLDTNIYHRFTIQDAKDGDVLTWDNTTCIVLFKNIKNSKCFVSYCFYNNICFEIGTSHYIDDCHPATKEQRNTLMKAMADAGYTFDFEKKELKKIKQDPWGEENSPYYDDICEILINLLHSETANVNKDAVQKDLDWLKSLSPQNKWKPNDKQMEVLWKYAEQNNYDGFILTSLHQQLKKLREQ